MNDMLKYVSRAALAAPFLSMSVAHSQETGAAPVPTGRLEEIVVTARRRQESLQDVPISAIVQTGEDLARAQVNSITELERLAPGFVFNNYEGGGQATMGIRGLSTFSNETAVPQSVSIVVDDVVVGNIGQAVTEFNDIERIEVLRGPQGTLFGRNTSAGVVHIVTRDPTTEQVEGQLSVGYGSYDEVKWNGTLNVPITENSAARVSIYSINRDGYIENINNGQLLGTDEQFGLRGKFLYTPGEDTRLTLTGTYVERNQDGRVDPIVKFGPFASDSSKEFNAGIVGPENDKVNGNGFHPFEDKIGDLSLIWEQALGDFDLTSITAVEYWEWFFSKDAPFRTFWQGNRLPDERFFVSFEQTVWSQELRLTSPADQRLTYVVGAFVSGRDATERRDFNFEVGGDPDPANAIFAWEQASQDTEPLTYAVFGEADFHLTDAWTLIAGARWTEDETDVTVNASPVPGFIPEEGIGFDEQGRLYIPILTSVNPGTHKESVSDSPLSWRGGLRWEPTSDLTFYATASRGFKGPTITALGALPVTVDSEIATNYEAGVKARFLENRLYTELTVFTTDVDDFQAEGAIFISTPEGTVTNFILQNAAQVSTDGVELQLSAALTDQLTFDLAAAYIDAKYDSFPNAVCYESQTVEEGCIPTSDDPSTSVQDLSGKPLPFTPDWSGNASLTYDFALPLNPYARLDYNYKSEIYWEPGIAPLTRADAYGVLGLTVGLRSADERLEVVGFVKNLTDEYVVNSLGGGNGAIEARLLPEYQRTWGITFTYNFP
jgi:iron complex outermembrane receptor protein